MLQFTWSGRRARLPRRRTFLKIETLESRTVPALTVVATTPAAIFDGSILPSTGKLKVAFSDSDLVGAATADNYDLRNIGPDGLAGTSDDVPVTISSVSYNSADPPGTMTLTLAGAVAVSPDAYQFTARDTITTGSGEALDGNVDGVPGGDFIRLFDVAPKEFQVAGFPNPTTAGEPGLFTVTALDGDGNLATGYRGTVTFISNDSKAVLPDDYTFTEADAGSRAFSATLNNTGTKSITVIDTAIPEVTGKQVDIVVNPSTEAANFIISLPETTTAGETVQMTVTVKDSSGNIAAGYRGTIRFTSTDPAAVLPDDYTFTATDAGIHAFDVILKTAGTRSITVEDVGGSASKTESLVVSAATVSRFAVEAPGASTAGSSFRVTVTAEDAFGNRVTTYQETVRVSSTDSLASLPADFTFTANDNGIRSFSATFKTSGLQTLTVTDLDQSSVTGEALVAVSPKPASKFRVQGFPSNIQAGTAGSFTVIALDPYGNVATGYRGTVAFSSSDPRAALPADYTFTEADDGVRSFSATLNTPGTQYIKAADTNAGFSAKQTDITVTSSSAETVDLEFGAPTKPPVTGGSFKIDVRAIDAQGQPTSSYRGTVHFTSTDPEAILPAPYTFTAADAGVHTFTITLKTAGAQTLTVSDSTNGFTAETTIEPSPFRYASSSNIIYVSGPVEVTLSDIKAALPAAPLTLVDPDQHVWFLEANLRLTQGAKLNLHGTSVGGDVNELRLKSNNTSGVSIANNIVYIRADWGTIDIDSTKIKSWSEFAGGADTEYATHGRAYIQVRSSLAPDGITPRESRMDIHNSDIGYLGYNASEAYGLSWKVIGSKGAAVTDANGNPTYELYEKVDVFGNMIDSRVHHNFFGVFTYGGYGMQFLDNEVDNNIGYGLDPHDDSDHLLIRGNHVHHNGYDGIIISKRCDHAQFIDNISEFNGENGLFFHFESNDGLMEGNISRNNGKAGITVLGSVRNIIRDNVVTGNTFGIKVSAGSSDNLFDRNDVGESRRYGIYLRTESNTSVLHGDGRQRNNVFRNNAIHDGDSFAIRAINTSDTLFEGNTFANNASSKLSFEDARGDLFEENTIQPDTYPYATNSSSLIIRNQTNIKVRLDSTSQITFDDPDGRIFDAIGLSVPTTTTGTGPSIMVLTLADLGGNSSARVLTRPLTAHTSSAESIQVEPTVWETGGDRPKEWTAQATSASQSVTFTVGDLVPSQMYSIMRDGVVIGEATADADGTLSFTDLAGTTASVTYALSPS